MQTPASYHVPHVSSVMRGPDMCEDVADDVCYDADTCAAVCSCSGYLSIQLSNV